MDRTTRLYKRWQGRPYTIYREYKNFSLTVSRLSILLMFVLFLERCAVCRSWSRITYSSSNIPSLGNTKINKQNCQSIGWAVGSRGDELPRAILTHKTWTFCLFLIRRKNSCTRGRLLFYKTLVHTVYAQRHNGHDMARKYRKVMSLSIPICISWAGVISMHPK